MDQKFSVPGKEGWETNVAITQHFHGTGGDTAPIVPVVTLPQGETVDSPGVDAQLAKVDKELHKALPGARIASFASTGNRAFVSKDGRTTFAIVYPQPDPNSAFGENIDAAKDARSAMTGVTVGGAPVHVSGFDALQNESGGDSGTGVLLESVLGGGGALIVLAFVFASLLALLPLAMAIVSIMTTFLPVMLSKFGHKLDWPHKRTDDRASRAWTRWAELVVRHRVIAASVAVAILAALIIAATGLTLGDSSPDTIAKQGDAKEGLVALEDSGIGSGTILPTEILTNGTNPNKVAADVRAVPGVHGAVAPGGPEWQNNGVSEVLAFPVADDSTATGRTTLDHMRNAAHSAGPDVRVGGLPA